MVNSSKEETIPVVHAEIVATMSQDLQEIAATLEKAGYVRIVQKIPEAPA